MIHRCVLPPEFDSSRENADSPIDVFWFSLGETLAASAVSDPDAMSNIVTADEAAQFSRLRVDTVRRRRVAARAMLRCLLSAVLDVGPRRIIFGRGTAGKPSIAWPRTRLHFNVSHSEGLAVVAVSRVIPVGIDVEVISELISPETLARLCGQQWERPRLRLGGSLALPNGATQRRGTRTASDRELLESWVGEEARRKATGVGWSGVPIGGAAVADETRDACLFDETVVSSLSVPLPNHVAALALADRARTTLPDVRPWWVSVGNFSAGTLAIHAQCLAEDSSDEGSVIPVRSATYC